MNLFVLNLLLAIGFSAIIGKFDLEGLTMGLVVGYGALWITKPLYPPTNYFTRVVRWLRLFAFFGMELLASSTMVLVEVLRPKPAARPGIVAVPLDVTDDLAITLVANLISLTPGTLSLEVSADHRYLYVHVMFLEDPAAEIRKIKEGMEKRVMEAFR